MQVHIDFSYIIKRVIVGVLIALIIMLIKGNILLGVHAQTLSSYQGPTVQNEVINNLFPFYEYTAGSGLWANEGPGHLYFTFSIQKVSGSSTSSVQMIRGVVAYVGSTAYTCSIGTVNANNSTYDTVVYSADCPINIGSDGFSKVAFRFTELQTNEISQYRFSIYPFFTYEQNQNMSVNFDSQGIQNNLDANTSYINQNINNNTSRIVDAQNNTITAIEDLNDTMTDSNIDNDTGEDFFDDFSAGDDSLSAVITAPLRFFNKLTDTCSPLQLSVFNQTITLPCGSIVWGRNDFSTFVTWWNLFFGGIAIYTLGLKLFKVVHNAIDPENDSIESVGV